MSCRCTTTDFNCDQGRQCPERRYGWPTVRRYPRTLADAFPEVRKQWFDGPHIPPPLFKRIGLFLKRIFG